VLGGSGYKILTDKLKKARPQMDAEFRKAVVKKLFPTHERNAGAAPRRLRDNTRRDETGMVMLLGLPPACLPRGR
jgi:hypothetical protein